jgi:hypothetical protein
MLRLTYADRVGYYVKDGIDAWCVGNAMLALYHIQFVLFVIALLS